MTPHKHAELIKAWADGFEIEYLGWDKCWRKAEPRDFNSDLQLRIKLEPKSEPVRTSMRLNLQLLIERDGPIARVVAAEVVK